MINKSTNTLNVFDDFIIDRELPKNKKDKKQDLPSGFMDVGDMMEGGAFETPRVMPIQGATADSLAQWNVMGNLNQRDPNYWDGVSYEVRNEFERMQLNNFMIMEEYYRSGGGKLKFVGKFLLWAFNKKYRNKPTRTIESFFISLKQDKKQLEKIDDRLDSYKKLLRNAVASGQKALEEKLISEIEIIGFESRLYALDYVTVITEEQLVKFVKETKRGLRLDWIKNFTRVIPDDVLEKKVALDEHKIFDNWLVLHYDPDNKSNEMTDKEKKAERERRKDPILFGVLKGSRKLYYVKDWIDDLCDLTLKDIAKVLGEKEMKKSELTDKVKV